MLNVSQIQVFKRNMFQTHLFPGLLSGLVFVMAATGLSAEPLARLDPLIDAPNDELRPDALISGNWLVGIHTKAPRAERAPTLFSYISEEWAGRDVCVRVTGEEGRYNALYPYQIPESWTGGLAEFNYPTRHIDFVQGINETNSGVAVHRGTCDQISEIFVPVLWNALQAPVENERGEVELVLNINAGRADSVFGTVTIGSEQTEITCDPTATRGVGFNYQCAFSVPRDLSAELEISLERLRFGRAAPERRATIEVFAPPDP